MSEKKYIFKIDNSKYIEKLNKAADEPDKSKFADLIGSTSSDFKITCDNCLYNKEIKLAENFRDFYIKNVGFALFGSEYFTIVKDKNVIEIEQKKDVGTYDDSISIVRSNKNDHNLIVYFSNKDGSTSKDEFYNSDYEWALINMIADFKDLYNAVSGNEIFLLEDFTDTHIQKMVEYVSDSQLQTLIKYLTDNQLQALAENLKDDQLEALVNHLTNHQLQTLAQELNETKLKIIVPMLGEDQLAALVKRLNPEQLGDILPHLKTDQFKVLINSIDDYQLVDLARDLPEHHLTTLSKELWHERLPILVHTLEEDKLKDLVNKLDHEKLAFIAQDLTDPDRIKVIIDSLTTNPEKLQVFAHSISDQQFAELLNNLNAEDLKDVLHKLPHEKVISVIDQSGDKNQLGAVAEMLREKFEEQNAKQEEMMEILRKLKGTGDEGINIDEGGWQAIQFKGSGTELTMMEEYVQSEYGMVLA